jgi:ribonuclease-3
MDGALGSAVQASVKDRGGAAAALEQRIGYAFANRDLLLTALTHSSAVSDATASYQRLEFLGVALFHRAGAGQKFLQLVLLDVGDELFER